jgi:RNA polymerase sigma factor (sigma-70 family)
MSTSTGPAEGPTDDAWETAGEAYRELYRTLLRVAFVITGSGPAAEDVVHDVFVSAGPRIGALEHPESYLRVAVVNRCRTLHRRATRAPEPPGPDHASLDVELIELQDALASLSDRQRAAIVLRYLCDLPDEEIAAALKCRRSTVRSLVRRGLAELREVIR